MRDWTLWTNLRVRFSEWRTSHIPYVEQWRNVWLADVKKEQKPEEQKKTQARVVRLVSHPRRADLPRRRVG